jgi:peptidyl-prolyl cis-trans isomerase SurA
MSIQEELMTKFAAFFTVIFACHLAIAEVVEKVVAIVNSEVILESDLKKMPFKLKKRDLIYDYLVPDNEAAFYKGDRKALLEYMINEKIMDSEVKRLNFAVSDDKVDQEIRDIAKRNGMTSQDVLKAVSNEGLTPAEYKESLKTRLERQNLISSEIISKLRISDEDAYSEYLRKNPGAHPTVNEYSIAHIFFSPKRGGTQEAYARAEKVLAKLNAGQNFETLAEQNSEDPNFSNGGFLGNFKTGEFLKELEDAVSNLSPGQYSKIIKSKQGFHIVKLLSKKVSSDPQFEKEKERIKNAIFESTFRRQLHIWLQAKKEESFIRINEPST